MEKWTFRLVRSDEIPFALTIYQQAKAFMVQSGNKTQWPEGYPNANILQQDIDQGFLHFCLYEGEIAGIFALCGHEKAYDYIEGAFKNDLPYVTIHRIAVLKRNIGVASKCFDYAKSKHMDVRCDTHKNNIPMQNLLIKCGFEYCGIIYLENKDTRWAYHFVCKENTF